MICTVCGDFCTLAVAMRKEPRPGLQPREDNVCEACFMKWIACRIETLEI